MAAQDRRQLLLQVDASIALAQRNLQTLAAQVDRDAVRMDRSLARVDGATDRLGRAMGGLRNMAGTLGIALSGAALIQYARGALEYASSLTEASRAIGLTVEQYQILTRAALENGASQEGMTRAIGILNRTLGQARAGVTAAKQAFTAIGITPEQLRSLRSAGDALPLVMDGIRNLSTWSEQGAASQRLFGRGASELIPLLVQGAAGYNRVAEAARAAGLMTAEQAARADEAKDKIDALLLSIRTWSGIILTDLIPDLQHSAAGLRVLFDPLAEGAERSFNSVQTGITGITHSISLLLHEFQDLANTGANTVEDIWEFLDPGLARRMFGPREERGGRQANFADRFDRRAQDAALDDALASLEQRNRRGGYRAGGGAFLTYGAGRGSGAPADTGNLDLDLSTGGSSGTPTSQFIDPVTGRRTSGFGPRRRPMPGASAFHPAQDYAASIGTPVRAPAGGVVIRTGNNAGLGQVVWIDHGRGTISELNHLSGTTRQVGDVVQRGDVVAQSGNTGTSTGPHLDWRLKVGGRYVDPRGQHMRFPADMGDAIANAADVAVRSQEEAARDEARFQEQLGRAQEELLRARVEMVGSAELQASFEEAQVRMEEARLRAGIEADLNEGRIDAAKAERLVLINTEIGDQRVANIRERERRRIEQEALDLRLAGFSDQREILQGQSQLAETSQTRLGIELRLIDLAEQEERARLAAVLAWNSTASTAERQAALVRYQSIDQRFDAAREGARRDNEGPRARYLRELRTGVADVNTQLESLEVRSMQALDEATKGAIKSVLHLHGAFGDIIADLIMIYLRRAALGGADGGGGILGTILGGLGLAGGGAGGGKGVAGAGSAVAKALAGARAEGGPVAAGLPYLVGERGPEIVIPKVPSVVIPNHMLGGGGSGRMHVVVELPSGGDFDARVASVSGPVTVEIVKAAAPRMVEGAKAATLAHLKRPQLA